MPIPRLSRAHASWLLGGGALALAAYATTRGAGAANALASSDVSREIRDALPSHHAAEYAAKGARYWSGPIGDAVRRYASAIVPGMPFPLLVAFITPANLTDNTTEGSSVAGRSVAFHEIGLFQVPAGPRDGPAPNPNPRASNNAWGELATSALVVSALGRPATTAAGAWRTAPDDQIAVGLANLRGDYASVRSHLEPALQPSSQDTQWGAWLTMMAFSAGGGGAASVVQRYAAQLAAVDEATRATELVRLMANEIACGLAMGGTAGRHSNPAHSVVRTWQKFALARRIAADAGEPTRPYELDLGADEPAAEELIARGSRNLAPQAGAACDAIQRRSETPAKLFLAASVLALAWAWKAGVLSRPYRARR